MAVVLIWPYFSRKKKPFSFKFVYSFHKTDNTHQNLLTLAGSDYEHACTLRLWEPYLKLDCVDSSSQNVALLTFVAGQKAVLFISFSFARGWIHSWERKVIPGRAWLFCSPFSISLACQDLGHAGPYAFCVFKANRARFEPWVAVWDPEPLTTGLQVKSLHFKKLNIYMCAYI